MSELKNTNSDNLTLPIYLNQKYVFDLLAIVQDGFSKVETISTDQSSAQGEKETVRGNVGLSNIFAFLKFDMGAEAKSDTVQQSSTTSSKEKIHTPNSLFSKLRSHLHENKKIRTENVLSAEPGEFVEIKAFLHKNPIIDTVENMLSMVQLAMVFDDQPQPGQKGGHKQQKSGYRQTKEQMQVLCDQLKAGGSFDLIGTAVEQPSFKVVLTLDGAFVGDLSLNDIADGQFTILGKVTRVIRKDSSDKVSLLRKTSFRMLTPAMLEEMLSGFKGLEEHGLQTPEVSTEIGGPVMQLIPIAVFT